MCLSGCVHTIAEPQRCVCCCRLVKIGVLSSHTGKRLTKISATAELIGYVANIVLTVLRLHNLLEREIALLAELRRRRLEAERKTPAGDKTDSTSIASEKEDALIAEIRQLRARRMLRTLGLAQDLADALLAVSDLREVYGSKPLPLFTNKTILACAGLLSGCIGAYKKWPSRY